MDPSTPGALHPPLRMTEAPQDDKGLGMTEAPQDDISASSWKKYVIL